MCSVFEVQMQLSLVFATVKASEKNLEILCSLVIYTLNFKHDFLSKKSVYNTQQNMVIYSYNSVNKDWDILTSYNSINKD